MPAAILSSVVLPEPDGPSRQRTSPDSAAKEMSELLQLIAQAPLAFTEAFQALLQLLDA